MSISHRDDVLNTARSRLLEQFKNKPRIDALLQAWLGEAQTLEDALWDLYISRLLQLLTDISAANSLGVPLGFPLGSPNETVIDPNGTSSDLLDKIGKIVGQARYGYKNGPYATLISARIRANKSDGRRETLIGILTLLTPDVALQIADYQPATISIESLAPMAFSPFFVMSNFLGRAVSAGVKLELGWIADGATYATTMIYGDDGGTIVRTDGQSISDSIGGFSGGYAAGVNANQ